MIREFKENDLTSIMKLWLETNIIAHDFIEEKYWRDNYDSVKEMILEADIFVNEQNGSINGFIGLSESYIAGMFVETTCQSKGIGKGLLDYVKGTNEELQLHVYKKNNQAVKFYLREGFVVDQEQIEPNTNETELIMEWEK